MVRSKSLFFVSSQSTLLPILQSFATRSDSITISAVASTVGVTAAGELGFSAETDSWQSNVPVLALNVSATNVSLNSTVDLVEAKNDKNSFNLVFASHGGRLTQSADLMVPVATAFEQSSFYLNICGRAQRTRLALSAPVNVLSLQTVGVLWYSALFVDFLKTNYVNKNTNNVFIQRLLLKISLEKCSFKNSNSLDV